MASAYSRTCEAVGRGGMNRRRPRRGFGVSQSSTIKWLPRLKRSGSRRATKVGGYKRVKMGPYVSVMRRPRRADQCGFRQNRPPIPI